jgi:hypothetical protein
MARQAVVAAAVAVLVLVGLVCFAPSSLLHPARHPFAPHNIHYAWAIQGAPIPGEPATAASFGGGSGLQYMHMAMLERLPNGTLAAAFQVSGPYTLHPTP